MWLGLKSFALILLEVTEYFPSNDKLTNTAMMWTDP